MLMRRMRRNKKKQKLYQEIRSRFKSFVYVLDTNESQERIVVNTIRTLTVELGARMHVCR